MLNAILGILKTVSTFLMTPGGIASGIGVIVMGYVLKKIDNKYVKGVVKKPFTALAVIFYKLFLGLGITITVGLTRWKWTKNIWNKTIEPYVIDLLDNIFNGIIDGIEEVIDSIRDGLFKGLRSDNQ